jgi:hypothetical protein
MFSPRNNYCLAIVNYEWISDIVCKNKDLLETNFTTLDTALLHKNGLKSPHQQTQVIGYDDTQNGKPYFSVLMTPFDFYQCYMYVGFMYPLCGAIN